jgi:hypothetical protein
MMKKALAIIAFLLPLSLAPVMAQGFGEMPKEIFGRTDRTPEEIAAFNRELELRQALMASMLFLVPVAGFVVWQRGRRQSSNRPR